MKKFLFFCAWLLILISPVTANTSELRLSISGFESNHGQAMIAIINSHGAYRGAKNRQTPYRSKVLSIKNGKAEHTFIGIPSGEYAVLVFHDENRNSDLDTGFLGLPVEDYGFSNNASGMFGPPDYDEIKFYLTGHLSMNISLQ